MFRRLLSIVATNIKTVFASISLEITNLDIVTCILSKYSHDILISSATQTLDLSDPLARALFTAPVKGTGLA